MAVLTEAVDCCCELVLVVWLVLVLVPRSWRVDPAGRGDDEPGGGWPDAC